MDILLGKFSKKQIDRTDRKKKKTATVNNIYPTVDRSVRDRLRIGK